MKQTRLTITSMFIFCAGLLMAQTDITVIATGLRSPVGIDSDNQGNFYVAQSGTGNNDGEISLMDPDGNMTPLVVDIPSVFDTATNEIDGPYRAMPLDDSYFLVFSVLGDGESGPAIFLFDRNEIEPGEPVTLEDAIEDFEVGEFVLDEGIEESNPYSMVHDGCDWYIADAAANAIVRRDGLTGLLEIFATFPSFENPLPFGPPFVHPVPTRIRIDPDGGFLVSGLTGFPFVPGASNVWHVSEEGEVTVRDSNYTLVTDLENHRSKGGFLTLKFADFDLMATPPFVINSSLIVHTFPGGARDTIADNFGPSPGMSVASDGIIYVTEIFQGRVLRIDTETTGIDNPDDDDADKMVIAPNPASNAIEISYDVPESDQVHVELYDFSGQLLATIPIGFRSQGLQKESLSLEQLIPNGLSSQTYYLRVEGAKGWSFDEVLIVTR